MVCADQTFECLIRLTLGCLIGPTFEWSDRANIRVSDRANIRVSGAAGRHCDLQLDRENNFLCARGPTLIPSIHVGNGHGHGIGRTVVNSKLFLSPPRSTLATSGEGPKTIKRRLHKRTTKTRSNRAGVCGLNAMASWLRLAAAFVALTLPPRDLRPTYFCWRILLVDCKGAAQK